MPQETAVTGHPSSQHFSLLTSLVQYMYYNAVTSRCTYYIYTVQ